MLLPALLLLFVFCIVKFIPFVGFVCVVEESVVLVVGEHYQATVVDGRFLLRSDDAHSTDDFAVEVDEVSASCCQELVPQYPTRPGSGKRSSLLQILIQFIFSIKHISNTHL